MMALHMHRLKNKKWVIVMMIVAGYLSLAVLYSFNKLLLWNTKFNYWVISKVQPRVPKLKGGLHGLKTKLTNKR